MTYPFTTADSTFWANNYFKVLIPRRVGGKPSYNHPPIRLRISEVGSYIEARTWIEEWLGEALGMNVKWWTVPLVVNTGHYRRRALIYYYQQLAQHHSTKIANARAPPISLGVPCTSYAMPGNASLMRFSMSEMARCVMSMPIHWRLSLCAA